MRPSRDSAYVTSLSLMLPAEWPSTTLHSEAACESDRLQLASSQEPSWGKCRWNKTVRRLAGDGRALDA